MMDSVFSDKRFSHVMKDPRFRSMPKKERKVKIDKRFQGMFKDDRFKLKYSVDKKGRPSNKTSEEDLKRFYELSEESDADGSTSESEEETDVPKQKKTVKLKTKFKASPDLKDKRAPKLKKKATGKSKGDCCLRSSKTPEDMKQKKRKTEKNEIEDNSSGDSGEDVSSGDVSDNEDLLSRIKDDQESAESDQDSAESGVGTGPDRARGEGNVSSSEDEEEDGDWRPEKDTEIEHTWGEADKHVPEAKELGRRLAICNMDWDRIKARDLYVLLSSFKPTGGIIHSVTVYPSEFGMQKMKEENLKGPAQMIKTTSDDTDLTEDGEGSEYHMERLRQYQLNRLKYYYAVLECDSIQTASHIYDECDGLEYETSSARLDLRFIPDDMEFDQEPHSVCKETPDSTTFEPSTFLTTALCQSKVELTWDETERDRRTIANKKVAVEDINDDDFKAYLASSSEDETDPYKGIDEDVVSGDDSGGDDDEDSKIQKYKSLVRDLEESEKQKEDRGVEMEITWEPGLREATEEIVKQKGSKKELSVWEQYLERKKDKKRMKREDKLKDRLSRKVNSQKVSEDDGEVPEAGAEAFSDDDLPDGVDMDDPYFQTEQGAGEQKSGSKKKKGKKQKVKLTQAEEEERNQKQAELSLLMMDEDDVEKRQHFSLKKLMKEEKTKKKRKRRMEPEDPQPSEDTFKFNVEDSRFKAMYNSHLYNIDPSAPEFKRTKVMDTIINEKLKRRKQSNKRGADSDRGNSKKTSISDTKSVDADKLGKGSTMDSVSRKYVKDPSISALVSSVKSKTKNFYKKKSM